VGDGLLIPLQEKNYISTDMTNTSDNDATIIITEEKPKQMSHNSYNELYNEKEMPGFNLIELLEQAPMGKAIISYYNNKNCLNNCFRNKLVDIIMRHLFACHCKQYDNLYYVLLLYMNSFSLNHKHIN